MKVKDIESRLAWLGALVVLIAVTSAASSAFAAEPVADTVVATEPAAVAVTVAGARAANLESAENAAAAIARDTALGLDIELAGRTSMTIAGRD